MHSFHNLLLSQVYVCVCIYIWYFLNDLPVLVWLKILYAKTQIDAQILYSSGINVPKQIRNKMSVTMLKQFIEYVHQVGINVWNTIFLLHNHIFHSQLTFLVARSVTIIRLLILLALAARWIPVMYDRVIHYGEEILAIISVHRIVPPFSSCIWPLWYVWMYFDLP